MDQKMWKMKSYPKRKIAKWYKRKPRWLLNLRRYSAPLAKPQQASISCLAADKGALFTLQNEYPVVNSGTSSPSSRAGPFPRLPRRIPPVCWKSHSSVFVKVLETTSVTNSSRKPEKCLWDMFTSLPATMKTSKLEQQIATEISLRSGNPSVVYTKFKVCT